MSRLATLLIFWFAISTLEKVHIPRKPKWNIIIKALFGLSPADAKFHLYNIKMTHKWWHNRAMKILIEILADQYDRLRQACDPDSDEFRVLMGACTGERQHDGKPQPTVEILCDSRDVSKIFGIANRISPDAAVTIAKTLRLSRWEKKDDKPWRHSRAATRRRPTITTQ